MTDREVAEYPTSEAAVSKHEAREAIDYSLSHPRVYHTPTEIERARRNIETTAWGEALADQVGGIAEALPVVQRLDHPEPPDGIQEAWITDPPIPESATPFVEMAPERLHAIAPGPAPDGTTYFTNPYPGNDVSPTNGNVCPIDGGELAVASFDRPGHVVCEHGHEFPGTHDGVAVTDDGRGWTVPTNVPEAWVAEPGTTFWLVARYNAYVSKAMCDAVELLAYAHVLDAPDPDEPTRYAEAVAAMLDALATACHTSHPSIVDQPHGAGGGSRLHRTGYNAAKPARRCINAADLVWSSGVLDAASVSAAASASDEVAGEGSADEESVSDGSSEESRPRIREHVAEHLVVEQADFAWRDMWSGVDGEGANYARLFHTTNYTMGFLAASSLLGLDVGYAAWALDGQLSLEAFLESYLLRDGATYMPSGLYGYDFLEFAALATHLETERYPEGYDAYAHPRLIARNADVPARLAVAGRSPRYGDGPSDRAVTTQPKRGSFVRAAHLRGRLGPEYDGPGMPTARDSDAPNDPGDPDDRTTGIERTALGSHLRDLAGGDLAARLADIDLAYWNVGVSISTVDHLRPLFALDDVEPDSSPNGDSSSSPARSVSTATDDDARAADATLLPARRAAVLRPASGHDRGAFVHYSAALTHGHYDCLGLAVYGAGRELSYDPGHLPMRHLRTSFLRQTVAHNTAVVDECSQGPPEDAGGSLGHFATRPGYSVIDARNPGAYAHRGVETYRRTVGFVDVPERALDTENADGHDDADNADDADDTDDLAAGKSYLVDLFRVAGADTVDYSFHGQGVDFATSLALGGPEPGSVASPEYTYHDTAGPAGEIADFADEPTTFNAPPGNGYGLLGRPRRADGSEQWSATWRTVPEQGSPGGLRLTMLGGEDREIVMADGPDTLAHTLDLDSDDHAVQYALARETGDAQFVSVIEPAASSFPIEDIEELGVESLDTDGSGETPGVSHGNDEDDENHESDFEPVALSVALGEGYTDHVLSTTGGAFRATGENLEFETDAAFAHVRTLDGEIERARVEGSSRLHATIEGTTLEIDADRSAFAGRVLAIEEGPSLLVDAALPTGDALAGRYALLDAPEYARNEPFRIDRVERVEDLERVASDDSGEHRVGHDQSGSGARIHLDALDTVAYAGVVRAVEGDTIEAAANVPTGWTRNHYVEGAAGNRALDGRRVVCPHTGAETVVEEISPAVDGGPPRTLALADATGFEPGAAFVVAAVKPGDRLTVGRSIEVVPGADREVRAAGDVRVRTE